MRLVLSWSALAAEASPRGPRPMADCCAAAARNGLCACAAAAAAAAACSRPPAAAPAPAAAVPWAKCEMPPGAP